MRFLPLLLLCGASVAASAAPKTAPQPSAAPRQLGRFGHWIAATYTQAGHPVCYAFTRAGTEDPATGSGPVLSVTNRAGSRDEVAISAGPAFPKDFILSVTIGVANLDFYTSGRDAFARDGKAAVTAMLPASSAVAHVPGSKGGQGTLTFNLDGFTAAHDAMGKACPPG